MLGLKLPTDPRWVDIAKKNIAEVLTDHAWCEQKAASSAISILVNHAEHLDLVQCMVELAQEELEHFNRVLNLLKARGLVLGPPRKDLYVNRLIEFFPHQGNKTIRLVHQLLYSALIEARSCERFKLLSEHLTDPELKIFYHELMISEANHYTLFLKLAKPLAPDALIMDKWQQLLAYEALIMKDLGTQELIHG